MDGNLGALATVSTEFYFQATMVFMFLIHVGFCIYEVGISRPLKASSYFDKERDGYSISQSDVLFLRLVDTVVDFHVPFFGGLDHEMGSANLPWSEKMGTNLSDRIAGVFCLAF